MKRGQAALEFLSTYGFAFLVILVMIGALTYFGVFNVSNFLPQRCLVGQEFECRDYRILSTADAAGTGNPGVQVDFILANNLGNSVQFGSSLTGGYPDAGSMGTASVSIGASVDSGFCGPLDTSSNYVATNVTVGTAQTQEFRCEIVSGAIPATGEKLKVALDLTYKPTGGSYDDPLKGEIFAPVQ